MNRILIKPEGDRKLDRQANRVKFPSQTHQLKNHPRSRMPSQRGQRKGHSGMLWDETGVLRI